jgi:alkyl hydroperoxide reductase subunit F
METQDLIIIGGGPAGAAAGVYAARKKIKSLLITEEWGGQSAVSPDVQNFIGIVSLPGNEIAARFKEHVEKYKGDSLEIKEPASVAVVREKGNEFEVEIKNGEKFKARAILVASGSHRKRLTIEGAERLDNKGISYCASCEAPLFDGQKVIIVGGGNAGFEAADQLLDYASEVTLFQRSDRFKADPVTVERVLKNPKMKAWTNTEIQEIKGKNFVESVVYKRDDKEEEMEIGGVFVEIGSIPNSEIVKDLVELNQWGEIVIDHRNARTNKGGIWAAGDVTDVPYKQNNISMGDGVKALEDIYIWLNKNK